MTGKVIWSKHRWPDPDAKPDERKQTLRDQLERSIAQRPLFVVTRPKPEPPSAA